MARRAGGAPGPQSPFTPDYAGANSAKEKNPGRFAGFSAPITM